MDRLNCYHCLYCKYIKEYLGKDYRCVQGYFDRATMRDTHKMGKNCVGYFYNTALDLPDNEEFHERDTRLD